MFGVEVEVGAVALCADLEEIDVSGGVLNFEVSRRFTTVFLCSYWFKAWWCYGWLLTVMMQLIRPDSMSMTCRNYRWKKRKY